MSPDPLPATQETADAILPDGAAMEGTPYETNPGETYEDGERGGYESSICGDRPDVCGDRVRAGSVAAFSPDDQLPEHEGDFVQFHVLVHASESDAEQTFAALRATLETNSSAGASEQTPLGDEFASYAPLDEGARPEMVSLMRYGAYVSLIVQDSYEPQRIGDNSTETRQFNTLQLRRMSEAWSGDTPITALRDIQG